MEHRTKENCSGPKCVEQINRRAPWFSRTSEEFPSSPSVGLSQSRLFLLFVCERLLETNVIFTTKKWQRLVFFRAGVAGVRRCLNNVQFDA
ncbi:MAG TPA: hypothetical protein VD840_14630 [Sinorhizobium sp.]|nr:hypothetical protein [Sinorhizobium sp.]